MSQHFRVFFYPALALPLAFGIITPLMAQTYSPLFSPVTGTLLQFTCYYEGTNEVVPNATWFTTSGAFPGTNAHFHGTGASGSTEPVSSLQPSSGTADGNGDFSFYLNTTLIGQAEEFDLECGGGAYYAYDYAVGYGDVYYNDHPDIWIKTGGTTAHGSVSYNRYMQTTPAYGLYNATYDYFSGHPGVTQLCANDMALPFAGKFDLNSNWTSPHTAHDRGTAADIAGPGSGSCALANQVVLNDFLASCKRNGGDLVHSIIEGYPVNNPTVFHVHCNFADPATYPH